MSVFSLLSFELVAVKTVLVALVLIELVTSSADVMITLSVSSPHPVIVNASIAAQRAAVIFSISFYVPSD